jgi:hypothetical protein
MSPEGGLIFEVGPDPRVGTLPDFSRGGYADDADITGDGPHGAETGASRRLMEVSMSAATRTVPATRSATRFAIALVALAVAMAVVLGLAFTRLNSQVSTAAPAAAPVVHDHGWLSGADGIPLALDPNRDREVAPYSTPDQGRSSSDQGRGFGGKLIRIAR